MKRLILLLVLLPLFGSAQTLNVRGFGGIMMSTGTINSPFEYDHSGLNGLGGLGLSYRTGHFEVGLDFSYRQYSFREQITFIEDFNPVTGTGTKQYTVNAKFREPAISIAPSVSYHFGKSKVDWYAGLSPAYIRYTNVAPTDKNFHMSEGANGWSIEARVGAAYPVMSRLRVFAELGGGSVWIPYMRSTSSHFLNGSLSVGAQFAVWQKAPKATAPVAE